MIHLLGERDGTLHERVADVLLGRTVVERAGTLHERASALGGGAWEGYSA